VQIALVAVLLIGTYVSVSSVYTVSEVEQVIVTQFGKPVGEPVTSAGLKLKLPFIQDVNPIDKRVLEWDGRPSAGGSQIRSSTSCDCAMSAALSPVWTTSWAARLETRSPSMS
jgi:regulator of protease activity HflC (stomatin/prohibitin superfamily)